jgi:hypothetical protein
MARRRKARIGESAHRNRYDIGGDAELPIDSRAATGTKIRGDRLAAVADAHELRLVAFDGGDLLSRKARLKAESAAGSFLAGIAVADRYPDRLAVAGEMKLSTCT